MNIENDIFKRTNVNFKKLKEYGFSKEKTSYVFEKTFLNNNFKTIITIDDKGIVKGKVIDQEVNEEYLNLRTKATGDFVSKVRKNYEEILIDIKNHCFESSYFISKQANRITKYIKDKYHNDPEFLWAKSPGDGIFRNSNNQKWYGIIMTIDLSKIDNGTGEVEVMNVKITEDKIPLLIKKKGFYEAYHMNKKYWISIILNETLPDDEITTLIDESYNLINKN